MSDRNVYVDGQWYGPDYPDAGDPPGDKVDAKFLGRKAPEPVEDGDYVGMKAVTEPDEAAQFGSPAPAPEPVVDREVLDFEPVGSKAVETEEEAAAFRGRATRRRRSADTGRQSEQPADKPAEQPAAEQPREDTSRHRRLLGRD